MKANSGWCIWTTLAVCAVVVFGAMTWLTRSVLAAERNRAEAVVRADQQERMRLALWRMDSYGAALIVEESQRPVGEAAAAVPNSAETPIRMRFELTENGSLSSRFGEQNLPELRRLLRETSEGRATFTALCGSLDLSTSNWGTNRLDPLTEPPPQQVKNAQGLQAQEYYNEKEKAVRGRAVESQVSKASANVVPNASKPGEPIPNATPTRILRDVGLPRPAWIGGQLFLLRRVVWEGSPPRGGKSIEGMWLNTPKLEKTLLAEVRDLLPTATLIPAAETAADGMVLASFPWRLQAGSLPGIEEGVPRPIAISLLAGWAAGVIAILAASILVRGVMRLSERRASFVSAVTHELRTPLTTFRLYSEMLEAGAVKEEKRADYLHVLSREADRLSHLVENVLAFSRIERGSARTAVRETNARELLQPMRERFESRLGAAGLHLDLQLDGAAASAPIRVDAAAVEHVMFNLIDNAAKYATSSREPKVEIRVVKPTAGAIEIQVCDHGPGIPKSERKRIFRAFHKSARDAAESRPGVGLGLALSRRLARSLGGELQCEPGVEGGGACFVLRLPAAG